MAESAAHVKTPPEKGVAAEESGHCEHCQGHHARISRVEELLGLTEKQEAAMSPKEEKHKARGDRDAKLARRKRS